MLQHLGHTIDDHESKQTLIYHSISDVYMRTNYINSTLGCNNNVKKIFFEFTALAIMVHHCGICH